MIRYLAFALTLIASPALAEPAIPDTQAGHALGEYLSSFNAGDRAGIAAFIAKYHRKRSVDDTLDFRVQTGGLTLLKIETNTPQGVTAFVGEKESDAIYRFVIKIDPANPAAPWDIHIEGIPRPPQFAPPRLSEADALTALAARADALVAHERFAGDLLVARHGKILFEKSWGLANRETKTPVDTSMKFRLGSANKMFTAVAVLQLVGQGKLSLDGTVGTYLPDYPNKDIAAKVTIRELLSHTAGAGDIFGPEFDAHRTELKTIGDYLKLYGARAPEHEPGASDGYDNYGFILLGAIVEKVSGVDYYQYVRDHIFHPAGMIDTDSLPDDGHIAGLAPGYMHKDGAWLLNTDTLPYRGSPAGGGYSTLGDLLKFATALQSGALVPKALLADATKPENHMRWYGYGFETHADDVPPYFGHSGGAPGMNAELRIFPDQDAVVIGLSNMDFGGASVLVDYYTLRMPLAP